MKEDSNRPLYEQVKRTITQRIVQEEWPSKFRLPDSDTLAREFSVSRLTIQRALRELQADGLVVRIQGRGTFVVGPQMQCVVFELRDIADEIAERNSVHTTEIITLRKLEADDPLARMLSDDEGIEVFHSRIVHKEDGSPVQLEDRFVNASEAPDYLEQDYTKQTTYYYLKRFTQVTSVENFIRSVRAENDARALLMIDDMQPCLLLDRRTWRDDVPVTRSRYLYPGDRYRLRSAHGLPYSQPDGAMLINGSSSRNQKRH